MMLNRALTTEILVFCRGIAILMVAIIIGVSVTDYQVNKLTGRYNGIHIISISRNTDKECYVNIMNYSFKVKDFDTAYISRSNNNIKIDIWEKSYYLPGNISIDRDELVAFFRLWRTQFVNEANKLKNDFSMYIQELNEILKPYLQQIDDSCRR